MRLADRIATPEGKGRYVRSLFATIADRYDFITVALSYGQDRRWKRRVVSLAAPAAGDRALDLATGTGDIAFAVASRGAAVVALDITPRMIELARTKIPPARPASPAFPASPAPPAFVVGDMLALPFPTASFDIVTAGYGLRNVPNLDLAIDEIHRVLRPGGRFVSLDFNRPRNAIVRALYLAYLTIVGGAFGWILHRDPDTYRYIPASIRRYPGAAAVADRLKARGFPGARYHRVLGGLMAIHHGTRR
jgi:demethylmenaquinone methyltransferase/2-methoxy-6-polyprenyl-1,4-benzoquinol methylase